MQRRKFLQFLGLGTAAATTPLAAASIVVSKPTPPSPDHKRPKNCEPEFTPPDWIRVRMGDRIDNLPTFSRACWNDPTSTKARFSRHSHIHLDPSKPGRCGNKCIMQCCLNCGHLTCADKYLAFRATCPNHPVYPLGIKDERLSLPHDHRILLQHHIERHRKYQDWANLGKSHPLFTTSPKQTNTDTWAKIAQHAVEEIETIADQAGIGVIWNIEAYGELSASQAGMDPRCRFIGSTFFKLPTTKDGFIIHERVKVRDAFTGQNHIVGLPFSVSRSMM